MLSGYSMLHCFQSSYAYEGIGMVVVLHFSVHVASPVLFCRLFPALPKTHRAYGSMMMNLAANMLGLDNAATPMGLKAMKEMQTVNPHKESASNPQIMKIGRAHV